MIWKEVAELMGTQVCLHFQILKSYMQESVKDLGQLKMAGNICSTDSLCDPLMMSEKL